MAPPRQYVIVGINSEGEMLAIGKRAPGGLNVKPFVGESQANGMLPTVQTDHPEYEFTVVNLQGGPFR